MLGSQVPVVGKKRSFRRVSISSPDPCLLTSASSNILATRENTWQEVEVNLTRKNIDNLEEGSWQIWWESRWSLLSPDHEYEYMREAAEREVVNGSLLDWWGEHPTRSPQRRQRMSRVSRSFKFLVSHNLNQFSLVALTGKQRPFKFYLIYWHTLYRRLNILSKVSQMSITRQPGLLGKQVSNASCLVANVFMEYVEGVTLSQYLEPIQSGFGASWICLTAPKG